ncbi:MAG: hypothetical protein ABIX37_00615 [Gammaproteobacteria bacterium]
MVALVAIVGLLGIATVLWLERKADVPAVGSPVSVPASLAQP